MKNWLSVDWGKLFVPDTPLPEIFLRGTLIYLLLFLVVRFTPNRQMGALAIADLLIVVLIASAAQNALGGDYKSITDGVLLILTLVGWGWLFNWLAFRFPHIRRFMRPPAALLVKDGQLKRKAMQHEMVIEEELMSQLRLQGIEALTEVKEARLEADGRISVICQDEKPHAAPEPQVRG